MNNLLHLRGVYAAVVTPLNEDFTLNNDGLPQLLKFLAERGCHGALLMGTTGEGPSFAAHERLDLLRAGLRVRQEAPDFKLLLGSGTPSHVETAALTRGAFDLGADGVVVLPPYYYRKASDNGLFAWFQYVIQHAAPRYGGFFGYHIPPVTGVPLSISLLKRLKDAYPDHFAGIKDSSAEADFSTQMGETFGDDLLVLNGTDSLFSHALEHHAGGCITAMANLRSPDLRLVWDAHNGIQADAASAQKRLSTARAVFGRYPPNPPLYKALLAHFYDFPDWSVRPPLLRLPQAALENVVRELAAEVEGFEL